jgi:glycerol-3-phosphate dehydrogenase subunit B
VNRALVVGAGVGGTAAALAAGHAGMQVTVIDGGTGASTLATGAIDMLPWPYAPAQPLPISPAVRETLEKLGGYLVPDAGARLLTTSGVVRPARGHDAALLDVGPLANQRIGVVRCDRPGWHAGAFARAWGENYVLVDAVLLRHLDERVLPDADFAMKHDEPARLEWLAERLREALVRITGEGVQALVLPPCLGVERARARALSERVGVRCGEAIGAPGGPSGLRFERARDQALAAADIDRVRGRATQVARHGGGWRVTTESGTTAEGDAVILATGGLIGGGIEYAPAESVLASALPPLPRRAFRLTVDAPMTLGAHGSPLELPSTLFGIAPESLAWPFVPDPLMDRVGVLADASGRVAPGLFVAGDLRADRPRTWLEVFAGGVAAGAAAAHGLLTAAQAPSPGSAPPIRL